MEKTYAYSMQKSLRNLQRKQRPSVWMDNPHQWALGTLGQAHSKTIHSVQHEMNSLAKQRKAAQEPLCGCEDLDLGLDFWKVKE